MKTLVDYIIEAKKASDNNLFKEIAQALVDKADEGPYSFWQETDDFTGKYRRYRNDLIKFENILVKDLTKILSSYDNLSDLGYEDFTNDIQSIFVGDGNGETDYGDNAHDEILEIVEEVFKKFKIGKKENKEVKISDELISKYKKDKNWLYVSIVNNKKFMLGIREHNKYTKINDDSITFKSSWGDTTYKKDNNFKYLYYLWYGDDSVLLQIEDGVNLINTIKDNNGKVKIYDLLLNSSNDVSNEYKKLRNEEFTIISDLGAKRHVSNEELDKLIEKLKK